MKLVRDGAHTIERLDEMDKATPLWAALRRHLEHRLHVRILQIEQPTTDLNQTQFLRGEIAEIKALLRLADPPAHRLEG